MSHKLIVATILLISIGCASVSNPIGGEKDTQNPILISSDPEDQTINFKGKEIQLVFSEWIKVDQLEKKLIITPRIDNKFESTNRKNEFSLKFENRFADSTTYTLNFRDAIKDITEDNPWLESKIAFSTGNYLDSMSIEGTVTNLFNDLPAQNFTVGLYSLNIDTANLRQGLPLYLTTTNKKGKYQIDNIKIGEYLIYAFNDKNENLINNSSEESFAYSNQKIKLTDSIKQIDLKAYFSNEDTLKFKSFGPSGKDFKITVNKPIADYNIALAKNKDTFLYTSVINELKDIIIYKENFPNIGDDSVLVHSSIIDSIGQQTKDTFYVNFRESRIQNELIKINEKPNTEIISGKQIFVIGFNKPIHSINYDSLYFGLSDSIILFPIRKEDISYNTHRSKIFIEKEVKKNQIDSLINYYESLETSDKVDSLTTSETDTDQMNLNIEGKNNSKVKDQLKPKLVIKKGAFVGIENDTIASQEFRITFKNVEDFGTIQGKVDANIKDSNYIVELLKENYEFVDKINTKGDFKFTYIKPGKYRIRVIEDLNNNEEWDRGNPIELIPYEEILHYKELIIVKANWEILDITIDLNKG